MTEFNKFGVVLSDSELAAACGVPGAYVHSVNYDPHYDRHQIVLSHPKARPSLGVLQYFEPGTVHLAMSFAEADGLDGG